MYKVIFEYSDWSSVWSNRLTILDCVHKKETKQALTSSFLLVSNSW